MKNNKNIAIFAHFDVDNLIDDYVIYYLKELGKVAADIVFVSDCDLNNEEKDKISNLCIKIISTKHGEYDFGSYKRGIECVKDNLNNYDNLIIANDSCYGPIKPLLPIFEDMSLRVDVDFWGMTQNQETYPIHIQSYFVVFSKKVFLSKAFNSFFSSVKKQKHKREIIENYEIGLSTILVEAGFKKSSFIPKIYKDNPTL